jgi:uncharacterized protein (DUF488 family)
VTKPVLYTIGHSTLAIDKFLAILQAHCIQHLVDVRTVPKSRRNPQFNTDSLRASLVSVGIGYEHAPALGGWRRPRPDSPNSAWQNDSFRGYADYAQTLDFEQALDALIARASSASTAYMCAEASPYQCHRRIISDVLTARGFSVEHLLSLQRREPHLLTPFIRVEDGFVSYPGLFGPPGT